MEENDAQELLKSVYEMEVTDSSHRMAFCLSCDKMNENETLDNLTVTQMIWEHRFGLPGKEKFGKNLNYLIGGFMSNPYKETITKRKELINYLMSVGWRFGTEADPGYCKQHERALQWHIKKGNWENEKICNCVFHYKDEQCKQCDNVCRQEILNDELA